MRKLGVPIPAAAWDLDGHDRSATGGNRLMVRRCSWSDGPRNSSRALVLGAGCHVHAPSCPSLSVGSGPLSICARFRSRVPGARLLSKFSNSAVSAVGFGIDLGETHGLGIDLADWLGVSAHVELGRSVLTDGQWHHACAILHRRVPASIVLFVDGVHDERLMLDAAGLRCVVSARTPTVIAP